MGRWEVEVTLDQLRNDFEMYAKSCLKIRTKDKRIIAFDLKPEQRRLWEAIQHERRNGRPPRILILKARQLGFSTLTQGLMFHDIHLGENATGLVCAHVAESAEYLFQMAQRFYDKMIPELKFKKRYSTKRLIHFDHNDSSMQVVVANEVRGFTANQIHLSEFAFYESPDVVYTAAAQTLPDDVSSLMIIESTANGVGNAFHEMWLAAKNGQSDFVPFFSPWFHDAGYRRHATFGAGELTKYERDLMERHALEIEQIAWYRWTLANKCKGDHDKMRQEYPSDDREAFLHSGRPVFETDALIEIEDSINLYTPPAPVEIMEGPDGDIRKPLVKEVEGGRLVVYNAPRARHKYTMGIDPSEGDPGSDLSPITILNRHTLDVDACWVGRCPPEVLARYACLLGWYFNEALANPEANNHGHLLIYEMQRLGYRRFFRRQTTPDGTGKPTEKVGWLTQEATRTHLINCAREHVRMRAGRILDPHLLASLQQCRYDEKNKADVPDGAFMDPIVAFGLSIVAHKDHPDQSLQPLSSEEEEMAVKHYHEYVRNRLSGHDTDVGIFGLTADQLREMDFRKYKRDQRMKGKSIRGMY